jgi:Skp family chaperone for outer membrane proteins
MGATGPSVSCWTRRGIAFAGLIALGAVAPVGLAGGRWVASAAAQETAILFISRKRLLNDTNHAQLLRKAEIDLTAQLQAEVDAIKAELAAEEQELARLRPTLDRKVFEARVAAFDRKVRNERREAQERAAALQRAFRAARLKLVEALDPLLEDVRIARGADVIMNADQVLAADPALDVTAEAIARFNATVPAPEVPVLEPALEEEPSGEPGEAPATDTTQ